MAVAHDLVVLNTILQYVVRIQGASHTMFTWVVEDVPRHSVTKQRFNEVLALPESPEEGGISVLPTLAEPRLEIRDLSYKHPNGARALHSVNMQLPFNTRVAIVGGQGSGKNVLPKLLLRQTEPELGLISVGGIDVSSVNKAYLRRAVFSYCAPTPEFIAGTIRDNIKLLAPHATDQDILEMFWELGAQDFVDKFGGKFLDYQMGERSTLNLGAKNLINIVRSSLKPASFYVYNQCFGHVKSEYIIKLMQKLKRERRTCLFITYEREICRACNNVYVLKNGRVSGQGKHKDLMSTNLDYRKFYSSGEGTIRNEQEVVAERVEEGIMEVVEETVGGSTL